MGTYYKANLSFCPIISAGYRRPLGQTQQTNGTKFIYILHDLNLDAVILIMAVKISIICTVGRVTVRIKHAGLQMEVFCLVRFVLFLFQIGDMGMASAI